MVNKIYGPPTPSQIERGERESLTELPDGHPYSKAIIGLPPSRRVEPENGWNKKVALTTLYLLMAGTIITTVGRPLVNHKSHWLEEKNNLEKNGRNKFPDFRYSDIKKEPQETQEAVVQNEFKKCTKDAMVKFNEQKKRHPDMPPPSKAITDCRNRFAKKPYNNDPHIKNYKIWR